MKIKFGQVVDELFNISGLVAQIIPPAQVVHPQRRPDFIHSTRDREPMPRTSLWRDIQDWSYTPIEIQVNGKDVYINKMALMMLTGATLGYVGFAICLRRFLK